MQSLSGKIRPTIVQSRTLRKLSRYKDTVLKVKPPVKLGAIDSVSSAWGTIKRAGNQRVPCGLQPPSWERQPLAGLGGGRRLGWPGHLATPPHRLAGEGPSAPRGQPWPSRHLTRLRTPLSPLECNRATGGARWRCQRARVAGYLGLDGDRVRPARGSVEPALGGCRRSFDR